MLPTADPRAAFIEAACVPLHGSHASGDLEAANALLATHPALARADVHTAAILGDDAAVRAFLARDPAVATAKSAPRGWDALTHLCFSRYLRLDPVRSAGFVRAATALLDARANANTGWFENSHAPQPMWESALYGAAGIAHHAPLTRLLLERGADPNDGETPYHAPESYDNAVVHALVESGRLNADSLSWMLIRKADWHDLAGLRYLLEHGADPNRMTRWGVTALQQALRRDNRIEAITALLEHGADPSVVMPHTGRTGFALAAQRGRGDALAAFERHGHAIILDELDQLIATCARGDAPTTGEASSPDSEAPGNRHGTKLLPPLLNRGGALLAEFAGNGNAPGVGRLLALGVPVDARYEGDAYFSIAPHSTALHVAAWRLQPAVVRVLVERGAAVDARDAHGRTPLLLAVRACVDSYWRARRTPEIIATLLQAGASPQDIPFPSGYAEADALLAAHGAR